MKTKFYAGFSLIEMAVVLIITSLVLGSILAPISTQVKNSQYKETSFKLDVIKEALIGHFLVYQRFPCPATSTSDGIEDPASPNTNGVCQAHYGFVPSKTLGLSGKLNDDGVLVDAWDNPFIYAVWSQPINSCSPSADEWTFTMPNGVKTTKLNCVSGNLQVCTEHTCSTPLTQNAVVVILSTGENADKTTSSNAYEYENIDNSTTGDRQFVLADYNPSEQNLTLATRFDDIITWISPYVLYNRLVTAGVYP